MIAADDKLKVELDGPGVSPESVDPLVLLELAQSYFALLAGISVQHESPLVLKGLTIESKCVAFATTSGNIHAVHQVSIDAGRYIGGVLSPPPELKNATRRVQKVVRALPPEFSANVYVGPWGKAPLVAKATEVCLPPTEIVELRSFLISVGGKHPGARLQSLGERRGISLQVDSPETVKKLAAHIYGWLDVTARVQRDEKELIHSGRLLEFVPVEESMDETAAWRDWFRTECRGWDEVRDIEGELERDRS